jgi:hypothetical protein
MSGHNWLFGGISNALNILPSLCPNMIWCYKGCSKWFGVNKNLFLVAFLFLICPCLNDSLVVRIIVGYESTIFGLIISNSLSPSSCLNTA